MALVRAIGCALCERKRWVRECRWGRIRGREGADCGLRREDTIESCARESARRCGDAAPAYAAIPAVYIGGHVRLGAGLEIRVLEVLEWGCLGVLGPVGEFVPPQVSQGMYTETGAVP